MGQVHSLMPKRGFTFELPPDNLNNATECIEIQNNIYPTLISQDKNVKLAITMSNLGERNGRVYSYNLLGPAEKNTIVIQAIVTDPQARNQGYASKALDQVVSAAAESGIVLKLEPGQISSILKSRKEMALTSKQLANWYKKKGFKQQRANSDKILEFNPNAPREPFEPEPEEKVEFDLGIKKIMFSKQAFMVTFLEKIQSTTNELVQLVNDSLSSSNYNDFILSLGVKPYQSKFELPTDIDTVLQMYSHMQFLIDRSRPVDVELDIPQEALTREDVRDLYQAARETIDEIYQNSLPASKKQQFMEIMDKQQF